MGNVYYVGASDIASYLIVTPAGHILIDSGYEDTPPIVRDGILKLGFKLQDVKILLNSQAHFDHVAGQAEMQRMTGAKIYSSEREVAVLESGGKADLRFGREYTYPAVKVDRVVRDIDEVTLGGVTLVSHLTPGHSIGCTTWTLRVPEGGKVYDYAACRPDHRRLRPQRRGRHSGRPQNLSPVRRLRRSRGDSADGAEQRAGVARGSDANLARAGTD
jgi:metallo-beta-lactamase class B